MPFIYKPIRQYMIPNSTTVNPTAPIDFSTIINGQTCIAYRLSIYTLNNILVTGSSVFNKTALASPLYNGDKLTVTVPANILQAGQSYKWQIELFANDKAISVNTGDNTITAYNHNLQTGDIVYASLNANGSYPEIRNITSATTTADGTVSVSSDIFLSQYSSVGSYTFTVIRRVSDSSTTVSGGTVAVDPSTFLNRTANAGKYKFKYNGTAWEYSASVVTLSDYGIALTGTPVINDTITVNTELVWYNSGGTAVMLANYGITLTGTGTDGDTITVTVGSSTLQPFTPYYIRSLTQNSIALFNYIEGARTNSGRIWFATTGSNVVLSNVAISEQVVFESYGVPTVELLDGAVTITSQTKTFTPNYSHPQQVGIQSFIAYLKLHNSDKILDTSGVMENINLTYTFNGLQTGYQYDVKFEVTDILGQVCDTGWVTYTVTYTIPDISVQPEIITDSTGSTAIVQWGHLSTTVGEIRDAQQQTVENPTYINNFVVPNNRAVEVPSGGTLKFSQLQITSKETLPTFWWRPLSSSFNGIIAQFTNSTTGAYIKLGYNGTRFYADVDGYIVYGSLEQLSSDYVYGIGYVNRRILVQHITAIN